MLAHLMSALASVCVVNKYRCFVLLFLIFFYCCDAVAYVTGMAFCHSVRFHNCQTFSYQPSLGPDSQKILG